MDRTTLKTLIIGPDVSVRDALAAVVSEMPRQKKTIADMGGSINLTEQELLATICDDFGLAYPPTPTLKQLTDLLHQHLLGNMARGRETVLIIDEAQHLQPQRPAHRRNERVIAGIDSDRLHPGVQDAGAQRSHYSKRDDNEQQHRNLREPLHGCDGSGKLRLMSAK